MCILTTQHYACTCTARAVLPCGVKSFSCDECDARYNNINLYYACPSCQHYPYRALESFAGNMPPTLLPPVSLGLKVQPASPSSNRNSPLHTPAKGSFEPTFGWANLECTRERRRDAEVSENTQGGTIRPNSLNCLPITRTESCPETSGLRDSRGIFPHPSKYYGCTDSTFPFPGPTFTAPLVFADIVPEQVSLKRKRSIASTASSSSELSSLGRPPTTPSVFADLVAQERAEKLQNRKRKRKQSIPYSPHNDDSEPEEPYTWRDLLLPGPSLKKACARHQGSRMDGEGYKKCAVCQRASNGLEVKHAKPSEVEEDESRKGLKEKAGWKGWLPVERIPKGEFERLPRFDRRGVPILEEDGSGERGETVGGRRGVR